MMNSYTRTYLATAVRFCVNPALGGDVEETAAMCQRTLQVLQDLEARRLKVVLISDDQNPFDPCAVQVMVDGNRVALLSKEDARHCRAVMQALKKSYLLADVSEVVVGEHGYFRVLAADADVQEGSLPDVWAHWQPVASDELPDLFDHSPFVRSLALKAILALDFQEISGSSSKTSDSSSKASDSSSKVSDSSSKVSDSSSKVLDSSPKVTGSSNSSVPNVLSDFFQHLAEWLDSMRGDSSLEAQLSLLRCRQLLAASGRAELQKKAMEVEHLMVKWGSDETIRERCAEWQLVFQLPYVRQQWQRVLRRTGNLPGLLEQVEVQLRVLPGNLYEEIGDDFGFFSHLHYLVPPRQKLLRLLSLRLLRTLICRQLGLSEEPTWKRSQSSSSSSCSSAAQQLQPGTPASQQLQPGTPASQQLQPGSTEFRQFQSSPVSSGFVASSPQNSSESPLYLSPKRGVKIDFLRVMNAFYETGRFTDKDGAPIPKSKMFMALGKAVNLDLSRYDKDLSRCGTEGTSRSRQLDIFKDLLKKQGEIIHSQLG